MTLNQALDQLTSKKELTLQQQDLRLSLINLKFEYGGNMKIENVDEVECIIESGEKKECL